MAELAYAASLNLASSNGCRFESYRVHPMAVRIRRDGRIFCAALRPEEPGDLYVDDGLHYRLSVEEHLLVTEPFGQHLLHAEWWWANQVPAGVTIDRWWEEG